MRELQGALERQAYCDPLTDLANRALFMHRVHESLTRPHGTSTVLFLDLDDFKRIDEHAGHAAGDVVLITASERIRCCVRPTDLAAWLGRDEFAVLLEDADERRGEEWRAGSSRCCRRRSGSPASPAGSAPRSGSRPPARGAASMPTT